MDQVKLGLIGLGRRGLTLIDSLAVMKDVQVTAVSDRYLDRITGARDKLESLTGIRPEGSADYWDILNNPDIPAVIISTSWNTHARIAVDAMRAGKYVGLEVGGAYDIEDCWELVRTHEATGSHLMMLENCCYGESELAVLNMVKKGFFGKVVHCRGAYQHDLRNQIVCGRENRHYRFGDFLHRNGELYPTHELGPIANVLDLNRGNRMVSLCSMSSRPAGLRHWVESSLPADSDLQKLEFAQGDVTTTMIQCAGGQTILLTHDVSLPHPYSRGGRVQGTKGIYMEDGQQIFFWDRVKDQYTGDSEQEFDWEPFADFKERFAHPLWRWYKEVGVPENGHGGLDYLVLSAFAEAVRNGAEPPIDVYDAASWMAVTCLSEQSIAMGGHPVAVPDFTRGAWIDRAPQPKSRYALDAIHESLF